MGEAIWHHLIPEKPEGVKLGQREHLLMIVDPDWLFDELAELAVKEAMNFPNFKNYVFLEFPIIFGSDTIKP